jgi:hypothetical protein
MNPKVSGFGQTGASYWPGFFRNASKCVPGICVTFQHRKGIPNGLINNEGLANELFSVDAFRAVGSFRGRDSDKVTTPHAISVALERG